MREMFSHCYNLSELDLSSFNTNNVNDKSGIFYYCNNLHELNLLHFC